jgi:hypothetical protein
MKEHLLRRLKRIEEHREVQQEIGERKLIVIQVGETREHALLREGVNPKNPGVDSILVHLVEPGEAVTSLDTPATERK